MRSPPRDGAAVLRALFLTHLHSDHTTDLNDIFTMRWAMSLAPNPLRRVRSRRHLRPPSCHRSMLEPDIGYRLAHHDDLQWRPSAVVTEVGPESSSMRRGCRSPPLPLITPRCARQWAIASRGWSIGGHSRGHSAVYGAGRVVQGVDVLVQTVVRPDLIEQVGLPRLLDVLDYHSSGRRRPGPPARNGVGTLVLTHLVPAPAAGTEQEWIDQAATHFDGEVVLASDLTTIDLTA